MRQQLIDGLLIVKPTRDDVLSLRVGNCAPTCFGDLATVREIYARGDDIHGRAYVCYYTDFSAERGSCISHSLKEDELCPTMPLIQRYMRMELVPWRDDAVPACPCCGEGVAVYDPDEHAEYVSALGMPTHACEMCRHLWNDRELV